MTGSSGSISKLGIVVKGGDSSGKSVSGETRKILR